MSAPALSHSSSINEKLERGRFDSLNKDATLNGAICPSPECVSIFHHLQTLLQFQEMDLVSTF